ncbi:uncharacterized protein PHACADRAFT_261478 [Phanerochaete carnosa HHB-10118-sp]|uniref:Uncharacterized protein n=1 Tax=Phanerochaete carnosa (strain HHB-10118-sp) TaxID=650164 RepID=K5WR60_PHACS|nr:uncharacterized protein PHACADRAFT_261478 [Phanerochaete carnosa HHB-10118-sp]EKM52827.1 hypothetical protein PHACADRAFT_261478 [Phanerochaete carnosa HHB-10118-sp]
MSIANPVMARVASVASPSGAHRAHRHAPPPGVPGGAKSVRARGQRAPTDSVPRLRARWARTRERQCEAAAAGRRRATGT